MYITKGRKYHKQADGSYAAYDYFRLTRKERFLEIYRPGAVEPT